tara:strand:+ start:211 stop:567 length:357 start_codon:yes stop_codon:yes gene_type:complete
MRWLGVAIISCWLAVSAGTAFAGEHVNRVYFQDPALSPHEGKFGYVVTFFSDHPKRAQAVCKVYKDTNAWDEDLLGEGSAYYQRNTTNNLANVKIYLPIEYYTNRKFIIQCRLRTYTH